MTPGEIIEKLNIAQLALTKGNIEQKTLALKKAEAEKNYRIAKAKKLLELKVQKIPSTLIQDLVKGDEIIAQLGLEKDIAESAYYTAISAMENLRLEIETLRSMLTWLRTELKNT